MRILEPIGQPSRRVRVFAFHVTDLLNALLFRETQKRDCYTSYPLALEGALKLKEISYIHAEAYAAGELKHGPLALVDESVPVIAIAPFDRTFHAMVSNMQEVAARGGRIILITHAEGADQAAVKTLATLELPEMTSTLTPFVYAIPIQLIAYHTAAIIGTDIDRPRNLAKSVTVE